MIQLARPRRVRRRPARAGSLLIAVALLLAGCGAPDGSDDTNGSDDAEPQVLRVPEDHESISAAVDAARPGDLVLVAPGTYPEEVLVDTEDVTIRGEVRDEVVVDAEGVRSAGIVAVADGVRVENLTVRNATFYGVLVTGLHEDGADPGAHGAGDYETLDPQEHPPVQRFGISHVTATNNGLYGIYAFDAQHGHITDSYASGSADSGIYVGQCRECDVLVRANVAERNAVGYENANASDSVVITGNRFAGNRVGLTLLSNYQEAFAPQHGNLVAGNVVTGNDSNTSPAQAEGGFGVGVGISGGQDNTFVANLVTANPRAGVLLTHAEDIPTTGNVLERTAFAADGLPANGVDVANVSASRSPAAGNCLEGTAGGESVLPEDLLTDCTGTQPAARDADLPSVEVPPGTSFLEVPGPPPQPSMADVETIPEPLPDAVEMPDLADVAVPAADLLADRSGVS
ncbi:right-handed parallel beta-helix repeat-containing protein [Georgenia alba]|uniref:Nitrous oxide reductase family maturation protein NosD n=1 Tax=Georgenia alba TaxID=2233858 RepID=A0ABW2Q7B5_9MICO